MATSLGIHLRADGFAFALVEGGAKKHALKASGAERLPPGADAKAVGKALAEAIKVRKADSVCIVTPSGRVVLRELSLPFTERDKVLQVLKFEVESELYHLNVEDAIADFAPLEGDRATPSLLVGVMPKAHVAQAIEVAKGGGWDPHAVLPSYGGFASALAVLAPRLSGCAPGAAPEDSAPLLFAHLGPSETLIAQVGAGGRLRALRTVPLGWLELLRDAQPPAEAAAPAAAEAPAEEGEVAEAEVAPTVLFDGDPALISVSLTEAIARADGAKLAALRNRLASEVRRAAAAMPAGASEILLSGEDLPGWEQAVATRTGLSVRRLDAAVGDDALRADLPALGAAWAGLGLGGIAMNFRQEEHRYARGLERVEGPLTLALVGLIAWLLIDAGVHFRQGQWLKRDADRVYREADARVAQLNKRVQEDQTYPQEWLIKNDLTGSSVSDAQRIGVLAGRVSESKRLLDQLMGEADVEMPASCLEAWRLLMIFLEKELGSFGERWMIESFDFTSMDAARGGGETPAHVQAKFGLTLLSEDAELTAGVFDRIERGLKAQPWCVGTPTIPTTETSKAGNGKTATVTVNMDTARVKEATQP